MRTYTWTRFAPLSRAFDGEPSARTHGAVALIDVRRTAAEAGLASSSSLEGRICLVVGGAGDLGGAGGLGLAAAGATVIVAGRNISRCEEVVAAGQGLPGRVEAREVDVTDVASIGRLYDGVIRDFGQLDVAINAAGINVRKPAKDLIEEEWDLIHDTNLKGTFFSCRAAFGVMQPRGTGRIVNMASAAGLSARAWPTTASYGSSKAGVIHLTRYLAAEWAPAGVTVNCIAPGYFLTGLTRPLLEQPGALDRLLQSVPLARLGELHELVGPLLFLASDASSYMTGHTLSVDGGRVIL